MGRLASGVGAAGWFGCWGVTVRPSLGCEKVNSIPIPKFGRGYGTRVHSRAAPSRCLVTSAARVPHLSARCSGQWWQQHDSASPLAPTTDRDHPRAFYDNSIVVETASCDCVQRDLGRSRAIRGAHIYLATPRQWSPAKSWPLLQNVAIACPRGRLACEPRVRRSGFQRASGRAAKAKRVRRWRANDLYTKPVAQALGTATLKPTPIRCGLPRTRDP